MNFINFWPTYSTLWGEKPNLDQVFKVWDLEHSSSEDPIAQIFEEELGYIAPSPEKPVWARVRDIDGDKVELSMTTQGRKTLKVEVAAPFDPNSPEVESLYSRLLAGEGEDDVDELLVLVPTPYRNEPALQDLETLCTYLAFLKSEENPVLFEKLMKHRDLYSIFTTDLVQKYTKPEAQFAIRVHNLGGECRISDLAGKTNEIFSRFITEMEGFQKEMRAQKYEEAVIHATMAEELIGDLPSPIYTIGRTILSTTLKGEIHEFNWIINRLEETLNLTATQKDFLYVEFQRIVTGERSWSTYLCDLFRWNKPSHMKQLLILLIHSMAEKNGMANFDRPLSVTYPALRDQTVEYLNTPQPVGEFHGRSLVTQFGVDLPRANWYVNGKFFRPSEENADEFLTHMETNFSPAIFTRLQRVWSQTLSGCTANSYLAPRIMEMMSQNIIVGAISKGGVQNTLTVEEGMITLSQKSKFKYMAGETSIGTFWLTSSITLPLEELEGVIDPEHVEAKVEFTQVEITDDIR